MYTMISVISLWTNILYSNSETTLRLRKGIVRCTSRFYFSTIIALFISQRHATGCKMKSIFICRWLCLMYQHRDVEELEKQLNKDFENICDWFFDNKLSIHFGEDITRFILFARKSKIENARKLNVKYKSLKMKQHSFTGYISWLCFGWNLWP